MRKGLAAVLAAVWMAVCITGCGGEAKVKVVDIELTTEEYAFGVDKAQPELFDSVNAFIRKIKQDGTFDGICNRYFGNGTPAPVVSAAYDESKDQLVVATNAAFEPFEYIEDGVYYGVDMEIAAALAKYLGKELVIQNMDFEAVCLSVSMHQCDIAMAGLTVTDERREYVDFTDVYYSASQKLVVPASDTAFDGCGSASDVEAVLASLGEGVKIGVQEGTTGQLYVEGDEDMEYPGFLAEAVAYRNCALAVQGMLEGEVAYVIIDSAPAQCIAREINGD